MTSPSRVRRDMCPGVTRPWAAEDGALVRIRLIGGRITARQLRALAEVSAQYGDGDIHLTGRANVQLRALPFDGDRLVHEVHNAVIATGLVPSEAHDLVRNIMMSPLTGRHGGHANLRPLADELDARIRAESRLADLPGRFLFVLDDGRGDLHDQKTDLGVVAVDPRTAQLRIGVGHGEVVALADAADTLATLALRFLAERGSGPTAAWHVQELNAPLVAAHKRDPRASLTAPPLPYDDEHIAAPNGVLNQTLASRLVDHGGELVVTPWRGVLVPERKSP